MAKFTYTGENKSGQSVKETVEAKDRFEVYDIARNAGNNVINIEEEGRISVKKFFNVQQIEYYISRISTDDLVLMTRNLGSMLKAGLPLTRALSVIERQSKNARHKAVIGDLRDRIQKGAQFNEALAAHPKVFDELYISMVKAGEESGKMSEALQTLSVQMERASNLKKKIKGAMIYPAIVLLIMSGIIILMMVYVMPTITNTFKDLKTDLPAATKALIGASDFMAAHTLLVVLGLVGMVTSFIYFLRTKIGKIIFHWILLHLPVIGNMAKEVNSARTARTLSSLLSAGVDVIRALNITEEVVQNIYYKPVIKEAAAQVEKGKNLSEVFAKHDHLYPVFVGEMMAVGEETGTIGGMLEELAVFYEQEVERKTKDLSTIIEPLMMILIGGTVGFFAFAMISPIYSISDSIG